MGYIVFDGHIRRIQKLDSSYRGLYYLVYSGWTKRQWGGTYWFNGIYWKFHGIYGCWWTYNKKIEVRWRLQNLKICSEYSGYFNFSILFKLIFGCYWNDLSLLFALMVDKTWHGWNWQWHKLILSFNVWAGGIPLLSGIQGMCRWVDRKLVPKLPCLARCGSKR